MAKGALLWLGRDLRLADNPALLRAAEGGRPMTALYVLDEKDTRAPGRGARWWLRQSLATLEKALAEHKVPLILERGDPAKILPKVAEDLGAEAVCWNRRPASPEGDRSVEAAIKGKEVFLGTPALLAEPGSIVSGAGKPYQVFGPFWKACRAADPIRPERAASDLAGGKGRKGLTLEKLFPKDFEPQGGWKPGEAEAREQLSDFLDEGLSDYPVARDVPSVQGTSMASPRLASGEVSPRQIWHATLSRMADGKRGSQAGEVFLRELGWREFSYNTLAVHPDMVTRPLREQFERFPWRKSPAEFDAWREGQTGYPLIDASMRALKTTGWMHNRMRMVVASFLVKHLLLPWQDGEQWFWDVLVDADPANNPANWQWVAGCGLDAAPYFRIFNPMTQGERFDPKGDYVRTWVPELAALPAKHIHAPWEAPADVLRKAGVDLGKTYPKPIVEHAGARQRALEALATIRQQPSPSHR